eukprot:976255-Prymnesium_polylepis.1
MADVRDGFHRLSTLIVGANTIVQARAARRMLAARRRTLSAAARSPPPRSRVPPLFVLCFGRPAARFAAFPPSPPDVARRACVLAGGCPRGPHARASLCGGGVARTRHGALRWHAPGQRAVLLRPPRCHPGATSRRGSGRH